MTTPVLECLIHGFVEQLSLRRIVYGTSYFHRSLLSGESIYRFIDPIVLGTVLIQLYTHINGCRILRKTQSCRAWISLQPSILDSFRCSSFSVNNQRSLWAPLNFRHWNKWFFSTVHPKATVTNRETFPENARHWALHLLHSNGVEIRWHHGEKLQQYPKRARFSTKSLVTLPDFYDPGLLIRNIIIKK